MQTKLIKFNIKNLKNPINNKSPEYYSYLKFKNYFSYNNEKYFKIWEKYPHRESENSNEKTKN